MAPLPTQANAPPLDNAAVVPSPAAAVPCSCLLSSSPRLRNRAAVPDAAAIARQVLSAPERWVSFLAAAASRNPFLRALSSLSEDLRRFLSVQCRIPKSQISCGSSLSTLKFAAILPGDSVAGLVVANGLANFLNLYNTLLIVRLVLTWFPSAPPAIVSPLSTLCDPYLNIFRGLIPPLGGTLDLSPILAFLVLNAFTSTAAALPAELPESMRSQQHLTSPWMPLNLTTAQRKWSKRVCSKQRKQEEASD